MIFDTAPTEKEDRPKVINQLLLFKQIISS